MDNKERQRIIDGEHLDLLGLFHYITGGLAIAMTGVFAFQYVLMRLILSIPEIQEDMANELPPVEAFFDFLLGFLGLVAVVAVVYGVLLILSGRFLRTRKHRLFSFLVAIPILAMIPWGTILGVFTLVVLERASVKSLYAERAT